MVHLLDLTYLIRIMILFFRKDKNVMKWDKDYVREKYTNEVLGEKVIFYPSSKPKRLLVFFSSMHVDKYDRYSWFWDENESWDESSYLFIKDDSLQYYLGNPQKPERDKYAKIIKEYMGLCNVESNQVFAIGSSMGGYAAIYFAFYLSLNSAIVSNPQVDYSSAQAHAYRNWEKIIRQIGDDWYDLDKLVYRYNEVVNIYIEYGNYMADKLAAENLIHSLLKRRSHFIVKRTENATHDALLDKATILKAVNYFE